MAYASLHSVPPDTQRWNYVLVVDQRDGTAHDNAFVNVLSKERQVVEQQYLVSRNSQGKLVLRELPLLKRGAVFCSASVIQHPVRNDKLTFLFTSTRANLQGAYVFRVVSQGSFVDYDVVPNLDVVPNSDGVPSPAPPDTHASNHQEEAAARAAEDTTQHRQHQHQNQHQLQLEQVALIEQILALHAQGNLPDWDCTNAI